MPWGWAKLRRPSSFTFLSYHLENRNCGHQARVFIALVNICYMLTLYQACVQYREIEGTKRCPARGQEQRCDRKGPLDPASLQPGMVAQGPSSHRELLLSHGFLWPELQQGKEGISLLPGV